MSEDTKEITAQPSYAPGSLCPVDVFSSDCYTSDPASENPLSKDEKSALRELVLTVTQTDKSSRRISVEQAWKSRLYQRGYQHLVPRRGGGWNLPGANTPWGVNGELAQNEIGQVNVYGKNHDIIVAALSSEVPKVRFFPAKTSQAPDVTAADAANKFKYYYCTSNNMEQKLAETASLFFTDGMSVWYTRSVASSKYGYIDENEIDPVIPETENQPESEEDLEQEFEATEQKTPRVREIVTVYGTLECKVPTSVQCIDDMPFLQLYDEVDLATAKALYPWMAHKIKPSSSGIGEIEFDRIARLNAKLNLGTTLVTGDSLERDVTIQRTFLRPSMFMDVKDKDTRASLIKKFPKGCFIDYAGTEFACAYAESMDDHITILHSNPGSGQNRRALGTSLLCTQERLNRLVDLQMDFFTKTVPNRYYNADAFDEGVFKQQSNIPGASIPFLPQGNLPASELIFTDPQVQAQPQLAEMIQWFEGGLAEDLTGALPSLFGGASDTNTVGNAVLQRNQALQRLGYPWKMIKAGVAESTRQAVQSAAKNNPDTIDDVVQGQGRITVELSDLNGNVLCYPESNSDFPESWSQRQAIFLEAVQNAPNNEFLKSLISLPGNARAIKSAIGLSELEVPGADSTEKQQAELEILLKSGPVPNPQLVTLQTEIAKAQAGMAQDVANNVPVPPEGAQVISQLQQQEASLPPQVSTVPVMQDASEEHVVEAAVCQQWLISPEGRAHKNGDKLQRDAWTNVHQHWTEHMQMAQRLTPPMQPPPPKASLTIDVSKLPPNVAAQVFTEYGLTAQPADFEEGQTHEVINEVESPTVGGGKVKQTQSIAGKPLS